MIGTEKSRAMVEQREADLSGWDRAASGEGIWTPRPAWLEHVKLRGDDRPDDRDRREGRRKRTRRLPP